MKKAVSFRGIKYIKLLPYCSTDLKAAVKQGFVSISPNGRVDWIAKPYTHTKTFAMMRRYARKHVLYRVGTQLLVIQP